MNADGKLSDSNWICLKPRPIQALSHRPLNPVQPWAELTSES